MHGSDLQSVSPSYIIFHFGASTTEFCPSSHAGQDEPVFKDDIVQSLAAKSSDASMLMLEKLKTEGVTFSQDLYRPLPCLYLKFRWPRATTLRNSLYLRSVQDFIGLLVYARCITGTSQSGSYGDCLDRSYAVKDMVVIGDLAANARIKIGKLGSHERDECEPERWQSRGLAC